MALQYMNWTCSHVCISVSNKAVHVLNLIDKLGEYTSAQWLWVFQLHQVYKSPGGPVHRCANYQHSISSQLTLWTSSHVCKLPEEHTISLQLTLWTSPQVCKLPVEQSISLQLACWTSPQVQLACWTSPHVQLAWWTSPDCNLPSGQTQRCANYLACVKDRTVFQVEQSSLLYVFCELPALPVCQVCKFPSAVVCQVCRLPFEIVYEC